MVAVEHKISDTVNSKNPVVKAFFRTKFGIALGMADLKKDDLVLDFGCGDGYLKSRIKNKTINYDMIPSKSDIDDYTKVRPDKIFMMDVLEHLSEDQIREVINNFKKMNPKFELIVAIPNETWLWRKSRKLLGLPETLDDHITHLKTILKILNKELVSVKRRNLYFTYIAKFKNV